MALESFVRAVRVSKTPQTSAVNADHGSISYKKPKPKIIDADRLAEEMQQNKMQNSDWKTCRFVKCQNGEFFCTYFISKCAKEKCNKKYLLEE